MVNINNHKALKLCKKQSKAGKLHTVQVWYMCLYKYGQENEWKLLKCLLSGHQMLKKEKAERCKHFLR